MPNDPDRRASRSRSGAHVLASLVAAALTAGVSAPSAQARTPDPGSLRTATSEVAEARIAPSPKRGVGSSSIGGSASVNSVRSPAPQQDCLFAADSLRLMRDKVTISWYGYNGPFDVAKGTIVNAVPIDFTAATCLAKFISGLSTIDPDSPAESQVFWYLVSCTFWQFWGDVDGTRREIDACE